jgi:hypothetical protein
MSPTSDQTPQNKQSIDAILELNKGRSSDGQKQVRCAVDDRHWLFLEFGKYQKKSLAISEERFPEPMTLRSRSQNEFARMARI